MVQSDPLLHETLAGQRRIRWLDADRSEVRGPEDFDRAFSDMTSAGAGGLTTLPSLILFNERRRLVDLAAKNRLPAVYYVRQFVDAGGFMAYGVNGADLTRRAAT